MTDPRDARVAVISEVFHGGDRIAVPQIVYRDDVGHVLRTQTYGFDGRAITTDQYYDELGRLQRSEQPAFADAAQTYQASRQEYDVLGRVTALHVPDAGGVERTTRTDYLGYTNVITNALEQSRTDRRNVLGQIETVTDAAAGVTAFEYEPFGNLATTTDPRGNVIGVEYDRLGRKTKLNDPDLGIIIYKPDPAGRVQSQSSQVQRDRGERTDMVYDLLDRMTSRVERDLRSNWVYDSAVMGKGQLAESYIGNNVNDGYRRVHSYDALGRPGQTTQKLTDGVYSSTPTYDDWGRVVAQTYQRGGDAPKRFDSRYNNTGYLARVERGALVLWEVKEQDAASRVKGAALGSGLTQTRSFNLYTGRLDSGTVATAAGAQRVVEGYEYDVLGSVTKRLQYWDTLGFQERFEYDVLNRLKLSEVQGKSPQSFTYHADGSMRSKTGVGTGDYVYLAQGAGVRLAHAVQSIPGIGAFSYDNNGNLLNGAGRTAEWTSFDMPKQITKGGVSSAFSYGTDYQRTLQSRGDGGSTIYAGAQEVETSGGQVTVKTYWPMGIGVEIDRPGKATELSWTHVDRLGSPIALTDEKGVIREKLAYDAWGKRRDTATMLAPDTVDGKTDNRGYTNHEMLDQLDLVHMNGRVYDPFTAKFMSGDPLIQDPMNGQNYNRYSYVLNNPTNFTDPTGFACADGEERSACHGMSTGSQMTSDASTPGSKAWIAEDKAKQQAANAQTAGGRPTDQAGNRPPDPKQTGKVGEPSKSENDVTSSVREQIKEMNSGEAPYVTHGKSIAGVAAYIIGVVTGDESLKQAASDGLAESKVANTQLLVVLATSGQIKGGTGKLGVPDETFVPNGSVAGPYSRPSNAGPTAEQRASVQGKPCAECGALSKNQVADHKDPLVVQHYREGQVNSAQQRRVDAVQPHCQSCSAKQGGYLSAFSRTMKQLFGF